MERIINCMMDTVLGMAGRDEVLWAVDSLVGNSNSLREEKRLSIKMERFIMFLRSVETDGEK